MAQLKTPQETEDVVFTSSVQANLYSLSAPGGILCSNYRDEVLALLNATETIISWEEKPEKAVSSQTHYQPCKPSCLVNTTQKKLTENISTLARTTCVVLEWTPAHTGIRGNEIAHQLAKEGREKEQPPSHLSYREVKTLIRSKKKATFYCKTGGYNPNQDALHATTPTDHRLSPQNRPRQTE